MATATKTKGKTTSKPAARKPAARKQAAAQQRSVRTVVLDSAYATVGLTDSALAALKALPVKAAGLREDAPVKVKALAGEVTDLRGQAERQLDAFAARGRDVVGKVRGGAATKRALEQSRIARSQVKAAATSVRKAVGTGVQAVDVAAEKAGSRPSV